MTGFDAALASDLAVTWLGAIGTGLYLRFLWRRPAALRAARPALFLFLVLTVLLAVRGFYWWWGGPWLGRAVFGAATLLPIAMTLFTEHLLRRHHPRWLKLFALGTSVGFGLLNLFADLAGDERWLLAFMSALVATLACNAWFLLRAGADDLARNERWRVRLVVAAAALSMALAVTDFRQEVPMFPLRLGALGPLLLTGVLLNQSYAGGWLRAVVLRPLFALACAVTLAAAFALTVVGPGDAFPATALRALPLALAWILLTVIVVRQRALSAASPANRFLDWLLHAPLDSAPAFVAALRELPQTSEHYLLGADELQGYALEQWFGDAAADHAPLSLAEARTRARSGDAATLDAAEQAVDLLEKHQMTHALLVSRTPPLIVLLNLPEGADAASGQLRAAVIQRLARRLAQAGPRHA